MLFAILNTFLYLGLMYWYWKKYKSFDESFLLIFVWAFVAVMGAVLYITEPNNWKLMLWPYLYLFITFIIFIMFILKRKSHIFKIESFVYNKSTVLDILNVIYIACAFYELMNIDLSVLSFSFLSTEGQELYLAAHEDTVLVKGPLFYAQRYTEALYVLTAMSVFNYLVQGRKLFGWTLFSFTLLSILASNAEIAARGAMLAKVIVFVCVFFIYRPHLSRKVKKSIAWMSAVSGSIIAAFFISITIARFSDNSAVTGFDSPLQSVSSYFGHSMMYFNYGICDVDLKNHWGGARTFNYFSTTLFGIDYHKLPPVGPTHFGSSFVTFIGFLVHDFGYIGTMIFGLVVSYVMFKLWSGKNTMTLAGMYIYIFYLNRMIMGVFVTPPGSDYAYAWAILTYFFLKFILKSKKGEEIKKLAISVTEKIKV